MPVLRPLAPSGGSVILIWRGLGILAPLLIGLELFLLMLVPASLSNGLQKMLQFLIVLAATFGIWYLGRSLNMRPGKILIDPETGEKVELRQSHSFFWIPLEYWAFIGAIICVFLISGSSGTPPQP